MYTEEDLLPLSALQHLLFCERQCALIHIEQIWVENLYTAEGRVMHERVDSGRSESRRDVRLAFGLPLRSLRLGLTGKADAVEFHREEGKTGGERSSSSPLWRPFPVEYKRGRPKKELWDKVQLCAQAMCLEEMLDVEVPRGALFYGKTRRRVDVVFDAELRRKTEETAGRLHDLIASGVTPPAVYDEKCESCSFISLCLPKATGGKRSVARYLAEMMQS
ncbi:CRISPR-associated protein Cas4 [Desulforhabdus amnigena]|jgi:CRISPR-associated exonuclease Cas4|uniref:CRISPR-associated exonuclease Cas4 n=1 Tax=Desulforhabdus amnigena TaxID=40218 RepID=A0A9W6CYR9_9BACT|nr:CRISPR-associated protein Cas4 [Desulforhabdus amnigena]NLJ29257.1 CRISPR-associated protein Cas4 [Deltaproteobacteria bacterium]GLI34276.1 CRISPR-associated protein Cas4 [Desulforhabdus amnigena]